MSEQVTIADLERRWQDTLAATGTAVSKHPAVYRELKTLANDIVERPLDIKAYMPTAEKMAGLLKTMDPIGMGSIFCFFNDRIAPCNIWQVPLLRLECKDLIAHLKVFDEWRFKKAPLKLVQ